MGIMGSGNIGSTLARHLGKLGHQVSIANSRGPATLATIASETGASAATVEEAAQNRDVVIIAIPAKGITQFTLLRLPKDAQEHLAALTAPELIRAFSVRQLRVVAQMPAAQRQEAFAEMRADCEHPVHGN